MQMSRTDQPAAGCVARQAGASARPISTLQFGQAVNIMRTVNSTMGPMRRLAVLAASLTLAACGSSQNWDDDSQFVTVGGSVAGLSGTLALWNNGGDKLTLTANGGFTFPLQIANGSNYVVLVASQPAGQTCTVTNGSGVASGNVRNVTVSCATETFTRRPLPAIYSTGKAVNYSPYRTAGGPREFEVPSDTDILQDLTLLNTAGYNLLRLFGAEAPATDVVAEKILRLAAEYYPDMKFQLGTSLGGLTSCSDTKNDRNISYLISNLSKYPNVVTISVGNETSFYSKYMPLPCLENYIRTIRSQVTQPVTADDDWTFYAGKSSGGGDRVEVKPDTILPLIDFAAIHMYPISYPVWDWQQTGVAAGPDRAEAMMEQSLVAAKEWFNEVVQYQYVAPGGLTVSVGDTMPIIVTETGWKAVQTNPGSEIEQYAALPPNSKWYYDLLYGNPGLYSSWQGSVGGPAMIFWFEAFDEQWKGIDDGWGLWDLQRNARYTLCGNPAGPACNADIYAGAGYYDPPPFSTITFDSPAISYALVGFGGAEDSQVVTDPTSAANRVARVNRSATAETFAGTVVGTSGGLTVGAIPFDASNTRMAVRVYSPAAGIRVRLKVEDSTNPASSVETEAVTTAANAWETLTFDFAAPVAGTPGLNLDVTYNRLIIFFNFGVAGATAGAQTYYFDDVAFIGGGGLPVGPFSDLTFDSADATYTLTGFGGAEDSSLQPDPTNPTNTTVRVNRSSSAQTFAGTVVSTGPNLTAGTIPFSASNTRMTVRVYSPAAGIRVRLKVEDAAMPSHSVETEAVTTLAGAWETLIFDFANPVSGTPALDLSYDYNRVIIFFNFGVDGATAGAQTYYFDDVLFVAGGGATPIIFASGYLTANRTVEGGEWGFYSGNFTSYANTYAGGGFVDGAGAVPAADSYVYLVVTTSAPTTDGYMGIFTAAPGYTIAAPNAGVTLNGQQNLKIELGMAPEWFQQPSNKQLTVRFVGSQVYANGSGGFCQILIEQRVTPTTSDLAMYTVPLNSMTLAQACNGGGFTSGVTTLAEALARPIGEIHVQAIFPQVNTTVPAGAEYPTGFTRGSVSFE
jgi:exo-beta-1,3-glucanase (GH17 family)